jgi:RimJ/RimL family protein N-acetyltransferase
MILKGKGFILRHFKLSDYQGYFDVQQDERARKGFMITPKNVESAKKEVKRIVLEYKKKKPSNEHFAIEIDRQFAGYVSIDDLNEKFFGHRAGIGYCIGPKFRKRGITTEAVKLVTNYAFKRYGLKRIVGWCRTFNKAYARVLEKAGYKLEGILRKNKFKDGKYLDDMIWAKVK